MRVALIVEFSDARILRTFLLFFLLFLMFAAYGAMLFCLLPCDIPSVMTSHIL